MLLLWAVAAWLEDWTLQGMNINIEYNGKKETRQENDSKYENVREER